ncbi:MAG TPA: AAA family ATPase [Polyangiaceae bacterium]|nr:AAA family ATPase [Polyangiaceae bacterium]
MLPRMAKKDEETLSLDRYAADARSLVAAAQALADERKHAEVQPVHFLVRALERDAGVREVFQRAGANVLELSAALERAVAALPKSGEPAYLSGAMLDLLERAQREANRERSQEVKIEHLLNAISQEIRGPAGEVLGAFGVAPGSLRAHLPALQLARRPGGSVVSAAAGAAGDEALRDLVEEAKNASADPVIGRDEEVRRLLTVLERRGKSHPLLVGEAGVGKGALIGALAKRIAAGEVPTSLASARLYAFDAGALVAGAKLRGEVEERVKKLIGRVGGGREAILVARGIEQLFGQGPAGSAVGDVLKPALMQGKLRLLGTTTPDGVRRLEERDPQVLRLFTVLPIEEPGVELATEMVRGFSARFEDHHGVEISEGAIVASVRLASRYVHDRRLPDSALDLLDESAASKRVETDGLPASADRQIRRLESLQAQLAALANVSDAESKQRHATLQKEAQELEPKVKELRTQLESRRGVVAAVRSLSQELEQARKNQSKAREAKDFAKLGELEHVAIPELEKRLATAEEAAKNAGVSAGPRVVEEQDVASTLALWTGIPVAKMLEAEAEKLLKMEDRLSERVVGQEPAVGAVSRAVRRGRIGLRDPKKPIGSFLFLGPSGVGKTELAKALAEFVFDDEQALTRLDMSEFMERHMAQRLLGAPPGYADSEQGGFLTEAVRRRPYSVLLFDEVEKAHQDVFNLLLQVLDDGRLTDGRGRLADFSNTIVIMTSNIGSDRILETDPKLLASEDGREALRDVMMDRLREFFRPEFLNRIDEVLVFGPLSKAHLGKIVQIQLRALNRLLGERRIKLELEPAVCDKLVDLGYEPMLGARPIKRTMLQKLQDPLAEALLGGGFADGSTVRVKLDGERFVFEKA